MRIKFTLAALTVASLTYLGLAQAAYSPLQTQSDASASAAHTSAQLAREGDSRGRGRGRDDGRRHSQIGNDASQTLLLAREASERPRGQDHERPGDRQRRNRGGRG